MTTDILTEAVADVDPITFEVIRNRLSAITEEQAITLKSVSGSPVVTDATDFNVGTYLSDGSIVTMGPQVLFHSGSMASVVRNIIADRTENPGIAEGDMFILNNPYKGALHQQDVSIVAPVFHGGERVAWVGACAHQIDVGGMNFGSWAFGATEIQQEAMLLSGVKIVENDDIRGDLWDMVMGMSRMPMAVGLDLKAMIAANQVASRRLNELFDRYGLDVVLRVMHLEIEHAEEQLRDRLRQLPDGVFRAVDYLEHDGHTNELYEFRLTVTKSGDELEFDFTGTDPQAPGFVNCTRSGLVAGVFTALLPTLAPRISWNEGLFRPLTITAPQGVICNATWPAPVSSATISAVWVVQNVALAALSRLAATSPVTAPDAAAITKGSMTALVLNGRDRDGLPYGNFLLDSTAGGGGAYVDHDGLTGSGDFCVPRPAITNVESHEANGPILFLYRSILTDTGGAGRFRGGNTVGLAITPHDTESLSAMIVGHGVEVPNSVGLFGGLEGSCNRNQLLPSDGKSPVGRISSADDLTGHDAVQVLGAKPGFLSLRAGDSLAYSFQGGGGYGDPLTRDPRSVADDVTNGYISEDAAHNLYGVVLRGGEVDEPATTARRAAARADRSGSAITASAHADGASVSGAGVGPALVRTTGGTVACGCGCALGPANDWLSGTVRRVVDPRSHGDYLRLHEGLELREYACPMCGTLLDAAVARIGAADMLTIELR
ncbi:MULTISPECIES: hydantoinase B/oxoprolinase family protein [Tsukamurella]|uniref:Hydantoinase B/oxoprolinase family protein n=2 Tax=Tsukamurella TaxID=2060 RepID=A0A5C5S4Z4_9ACTN|nr:MULTISPECIES: hydantoinase B/oxoprolinase family protein [Tsukamurella]NMD56792.1 hydantoinase B/oxoprolinase family protein [Tsukamurella columbiensis]TWS29703.1 hydantoinase B/oxoprolinase family protein [Tsukamurella conjunctivitidis]